MSHLKIQLPRLTDTYDGRQLRALVRQVEDTFAQVHVERRREPHTVTTNYTLDPLDALIVVDTSGGNRTITLPGIGPNLLEEHKEFSVKKGAAANLLTIIPTGTDTIDGETGVQVYNNGTSLTFRVSDDGWKIV